MSLPFQLIQFFILSGAGVGGGGGGGEGALHFIYSKMMMSIYRLPEYAMCVCVMFVDVRVVCI